MSPATIAAPPILTPPAKFEARRWTIAEFERMIATGVIREGAREFLWDGAIVQDMSEDETHAYAYGVLVGCLYQRLDQAEWSIRPNNPLWLREGYLPSPDLVVLYGSRSSYRRRRPTTADAALVVEIANTPYADDVKVMMPEYARGGVVQYWIVNINARRVEVYRDPQRDGDVGVYGPPTFYPIGSEIPVRLATGQGQLDREFAPIPVAEILPDPQVEKPK